MRAHNVVSNHFLNLSMADEGDTLDMLEDELTGRDWAIAPAPLPEFVPLNPDPVNVARLQYENAKTSGDIQNMLTYGALYTQLRDAKSVQAPVAEQPKQQAVQAPQLEKYGRPKMREKTPKISV